MSDECRPVEIEVDGQPETIRVHGAKEPSAEDIRMLAVLVDAARAQMAAEGETVRQRTLAVLKDHWPERHRCACGRWAHNATLWSVHVAQALSDAGVLVDERGEERP